MNKLITQAEVEKLGYMNYFVKTGDYTQNSEFWLKEDFSGVSFYVKCTGCNRFFNGGKVSKDAVGLSCQCPFCKVSYGKVTSVPISEMLKWLQEKKK